MYEHMYVCICIFMSMYFILEYTSRHIQIFIFNVSEIQTADTHEAPWMPQRIHMDDCCASPQLAVTHCQCVG